MPRRVEFQGAIHEFPDGATDEQIRAALASVAPAGKPVRTGPGGAAADFLEGVGAGALSTVKGVRDLGYRLTGNEPPKAFLGSETLTDAPANLAGQVGKFAEQAAEFALPLGAASKATMGASLVRRTAAAGAASGGVAAIQSGGDPAAIGTAAALGVAGPVIGKVAGKAFRAYTQSELPVISPRRLYQGALKPPPGSGKQGYEDVQQLIKTGLREEIPVSPAGLEAIGTKTAEINSQIASEIQRLGRQGVTIDPVAVHSRLTPLLDEFNSVAPNAARSDIRSAGAQYMAKHTTPGTPTRVDNFGRTVRGTPPVPTPYSIAEAQAEKIATYKDIRKSYGERSGAWTEALKNLARGLKEEIAGVFPEVSALNNREGSLKALEDVLERALKRNANREVATFNAYHSAMRILEAPEVKSRVAIWLAKAGSRRPMSEASRRLTSLKAITQAALAPGQPTVATPPSGPQ